MSAEVAARGRENVQQVIVGKDGVIDLALVAILCEGHIFIEDVPGIGKTMLARSLAASLGCTFRRIYAHLGALAAERGYPRAPYEPPYEYLPTLEQAFPSNREEVACITEAYVAVHYGELQT